MDLPLIMVQTYLADTLMTCIMLRLDHVDLDFLRFSVSNVDKMLCYFCYP